MPEPEVLQYSFFVAGHTYGKPGVNNVGFHPPFEAKFDLIQQEEKMRFGVFTGDLVVNASSEDWEEVEASFAKFDFPSYIAIGNHDYSANGDREKGIQLFKERFGESYFSFEQDGDLMIVLDPNIDEWNISGAQLDFLKAQLQKIESTDKNIFVFFHQLLWWSPDNIYKNVKLNSVQGRADKINFWSEVYPLFMNLKNDVFMFAGDVGANPTGDEFFYHESDNVRFIASGMGGGQRDNFIITDVRNKGKVSFRLIALNCGDDINCLGKLEDYKLPKHGKKNFFNKF